MWKKMMKIPSVLQNHWVFQVHFCIYAHDPLFFLEKLLIFRRKWVFSMSFSVYAHSVLSGKQLAPVIHAIEILIVAYTDGGEIWIHDVSTMS